MAFDITTQHNINTWLNGNYDAESKTEIKRLQDAGDEVALTNAFYQDLAFGTGGLRGIMGVGSNRVNRYTLGAATQGFANYLNKTFDGDISVVLAHDCRNNSTLFANLVADVFSANGITVFFFDGMRPTPELSFAVRKLGAKGGVMLTASHNPKEYNGYKAYGPDGGQLVSPDDTGVMAEVRKINSIDEIKFERNADLVKSIGAGIDEDYYNELVKLSLNPEAIAKVADMPIVFSPIHGTGGVSVPPILKRFGFTNVITVEEQMVEDGNFPTVVYPNPEEQEALTMALDKAREVKADLVMATDPDADRVGIAIRNGEGELVLLNGNQTACLLVHYVLSGHQQKKDLHKSDYVVKTVVTSYMIDHIAKSFGVECFNTLTGFKFIGQVMTKLEGERRFLVGGEESYGYLAGEHARDKDAVISCALIAEMAAYHKSEGRSLWNVLIELYQEYGFYLEKLIAVKKEGKAGAEEIQSMMSGFRQNPPTSLGGGAIVMIKDYKESVSTSIPSGKTELIDLPSSNVLQFFTEDGTIVSARPSGTEPKIKFYCSVNAGLASAADFKRTQEALEAKIDRVLADLGV